MMAVHFPASIVMSTLRRTCYSGVYPNARCSVEIVKFSRSTVCLFFLLSGSVLMEFS